MADIVGVLRRHQAQATWGNDSIYKQAADRIEVLEHLVEWQGRQLDHWAPNYRIQKSSSQDQKHGL